MRIVRRDILLASGGILAARGVAAAAPPPAAPPAPPAAPAAVPPLAAFGPSDWARVRAQFDLARDRVDMSAMLITAHPQPVRDAISRYRAALDTTPIEYVEMHNRRLQDQARAAVGAYMGAPTQNVALTDSTTMGAGLVYNGLKISPGQEVLTTDRDYYVTHEAIRLAAARGRGLVRRIPLYTDGASVTAAGLTQAVVAEIRPHTRVVALTWVHSSTGVKLPISQISAAIARINASRTDYNRILLCVDGVHGFGNQPESFAELGCDFFFAGCHKWLFGPRGTGVVIGSPAGWRAMTPTIPTFLDSAAYSNWIAGTPAPDCTGAIFTPGGFKAFEHVWAMSDAFVLHNWIGKRQVADRTAELAEQLKAGLAGMRHVTLHTPRSRALSAGIVSFDVAGLSADQTVARLRNWRVLATAAPYARPHARLAPSIRNTPQEVDFVLNAIRGMA